MKTSTVPTLRARHLERVAQLVTIACAAAIVLGVVRAMAAAGDVPAAEPSVALIPAACATINPDLYPCPAGTERALGVRW